MDNKTTLILTFITAVLVPFIRDAKDLIDSLRVQSKGNLSNFAQAVNSDIEKAEASKVIQTASQVAPKVEESAFRRFLRN